MLEGVFICALTANTVRFAAGVVKKPLQEEVSYIQIQMLKQALDYCRCGL